MSFSHEQNAALSAPLSRASISKRTGGGNKQLSYIESHHAIRESNRIFGFDGWSFDVVDLKCIVDKQVGDQCQVSYLARVRVTVYAGDRVLTREDVGAGHGKDRDAGQAHEKASKESASDAQKRALRHFGDQFGLALYDKDQEHVEKDAPAPTASNSNTNAPASNIPTVEATPPKQTISQRAMAKAPAPRPPVQEGPRSEVERRKVRSEAAWRKLDKGEPGEPGISQLLNDLIQMSRPIAKIQEDWLGWCARVTELTPDLTEPEDKQFIKNAHATFKSHIEAELKARAEDAAKVAAA